MKLFKSETLWIFFLAFLPACVVGLYVNLVLNFVFVDAFKRSFMAYLVYFGNEPKLSAIGFVWPPLPTLLQLPLVLIEPLNQSGVVGNILSAIFFAISAIYLNLIGNLFKVKRLFRYVFILLFISNPLIFFYGVNGMAELIAITFIMMAMYYFLRHVTLNSLPSLLIASLSLACAIMTRWELGMLLFVVVFIVGYIPFINKQYSLREAESSVVIFAIPIVFVIFIWMIISWLIVGSPTYFVHSPYSFTEHDAKQLANNPVLSAAAGHIGLSVLFVLERMFYLSCIFLPLGVLVFTKIKGKKDRLTALTILGFISSIIFAHIMLIYTGKSYGELRYYIYVIPFGYIFLLFLFKDTFKVVSRRATLMFLLSVMLMVISSRLTYYAISTPEYGNQEHVLVNVLLHKDDGSQNYAFKDEAHIAEYISTHISSRSVLVDDSVGFIIIYLTRKPSLFIETVDSDFKETLYSPVSSKARYILISDQDTHSGIDILNVAYPKMFHEGGEFVTLEKDFGDWKLYRILKPATSK